MKNRLILCFTLLTAVVQAQEEITDKMREIPDAPEQYTASTVAARLVEGIAYRFYWASESLREEDLAYKPSAEARSSEETIKHIYDLSRIIYFTVKGEAVVRDTNELDYATMRIRTLDMLAESSEQLREGIDLSESNIVFQGANRSSEYPFWNLINGPISDAIWHCGQVVSFRRASGNPLSAEPSFFSGKIKK